jgi:uncharacterized protein YdiU (UPF0061 family)
MLLEQQPEMLPLFGLDVETVREQVEKAKAAEKARQQPASDKLAAQAQMSAKQEK